MINIIDKNAFYLRITGKTKIGEYETTLDMNVIDSLIVNFVRRGRLSQTVSVDANNRVLVYNNGTLAKGVYGVELVGYYNGQPWRHFASDVFAIVDSDGANPDSAISNIDVFDVTLYMKLSGDGVTADFVQAMMEEHNADALAHTEIRQEIPAKTSELSNDAGFQTEQQVSNTVQTAVLASRINDAEASLVEDGGEPDLVAGISGQKLVLVGKNLKGDKGDPLAYEDLTAAQKAELKGPKGDPGESVIVGQGDLPLANDASGAADKAITPKAVAKEIYNVYEEIDLSDYADIDKKFISTTWKSSNNNSCKFVPIQQGWKRIKIVAQIVNGAEKSYHVEFMTSNEVSGTVAYATEAARGWRTSANEDDYIEVPESATFIYLRSLNGGASSLPAYIGYAIDIAEMNSKVIEKIAEQAVVTKDNVKTELMMHQLEYYNSGNFTAVGIYIDGSGKWHSSSAVTTNSCKFLPVEPGEMFKISNNPNGATSHHAIFLTTNSYTAGQAPSLAGGATKVHGWIADDEYVIAPEDARYLYVRVYNGGNLMTPYTQRIVSVGEQLKEMDGLTERNIAEQAKFVSPEPTIKALTLLHYSDLHGDSYALKHLLESIERHKNVLDDILVTGDVVHFYADATSAYPNDHVWWENSGLPEKSLFVLGNHDGSTSNDTTFWDAKGQAWDFEHYFEPYADGLGINLPDGYDDSESPYYQACYWHKDYAAQKIRLIGLDAIHRFDGVMDAETGDINEAGWKHLTNEQELWLIERLNETLAGSGDDAEGYSVIVCAHWPLDDFSGEGEGGYVVDHKTNDICNWHYRNHNIIDEDKKYNFRNRDNSVSPWAKGEDNNVGDILQNFIDNNGKFVAFICGHYHADLMFYPDKYPNILNIAVTQTGWLRPGGEANKEAVNYSRMSANIIAFDTENHLIKIMRLGLKTDRFLTPKNAICYDYVNHKVINEW